MTFARSAFFCLTSGKPFFRPDRRPTSPSCRAAVKDGRHSWRPPEGLVLDGREHGGRLPRGGAEDDHDRRCSQFRFPRPLQQSGSEAGSPSKSAKRAPSICALTLTKFRRILFLADRANLVRQARDEFMAYRPPGTGRSFTELYNVQRLGLAGLDKDAV